MSAALYRLYDDHDTLLYVGIAKSVLSRLGQHVSDKRWAQQVAIVRIEWHPTREEAAAAEVAAIVTEQPRHNIAHSNEAVLARAALRGDTDNPRAHAALEREQLRLAGRTHW